MKRGAKIGESEKALTRHEGYVLLLKIQSDVKNHLSKINMKDRDTRRKAKLPKSHGEVYPKRP